MITLGATVSTGTSFDLAGTFFCQEHESREGIAATVMGEGRWDFRLEALESVELCKFFRDGNVALSSKFFKASLEAILPLFCLRVSAQYRELAV